MSGIIGGVGSRSGVIGTTELDYEEGNWTPEFRGSTGSAGTSVSGGAGSYVKIGKLVTIRVQANWSNKGSWTGVVQIYGLPFTVGSHAGNYGNSMMLSMVDNVSYTDPLKLYGWPSIAYLKVYEGAATALSVSDITATAYISFTSNYEV